MSKISEKRRQDILDAAEVEFGIRGVEGTSMSDIAARAGIGKSTIYEYFPSKASLFAAGYQKTMLEISERIQGIFEQDTTFRNQMVSYCETLLSVLRGVNITSVLRVVLDDPNAGGLADSGKMLQRRTVFQIAQAISRAQDRGEVSRDLDVEATSYYLAFLPDPHLICCMQTSGEENSVEKIVDLAFQGILPRPETDLKPLNVKCTAVRRLY